MSDSAGSEIRLWPLAPSQLSGCDRRFARQCSGDRREHVMVRSPNHRSHALIERSDLSFELGDLALGRSRPIALSASILLAKSEIRQIIAKHAKVQVKAATKDHDDLEKLIRRRNEAIEKIAFAMKEVRRKQVKRISDKIGHCMSDSCPMRYRAGVWKM